MTPGWMYSPCSVAPVLTRLCCTTTISLLFIKGASSTPNPQRMQVSIRFNWEWKGSEEKRKQKVYGRYQGRWKIVQQEVGEKEKNGIGGSGGNQGYSIQ